MTKAEAKQKRLAEGVIRPPSDLATPTLSMYEYVARNMRADEIEQYLALTGAPKYDFNEAALSFANAGGVKFALADKTGMPYCIGGYEPRGPHVWQSWMMGTDAGWNDHWRTITKGTLWLIQQLLDGGANRLQTNCLASREAAMAWYTDSLKMQPEGIFREYGVNGEDVACFAITRTSWYGRRLE